MDEPNTQMLQDEIATWKAKAEEWKANALVHWQTIDALQQWVMQNGGDALWVPGTTLDQSLIAHLNRLEKWVDDLQAGMSINCVYCGHNYGPNGQTVARDALTEHIATCQLHPFNIEKNLTKRLRVLCALFLSLDHTSPTYDEELRLIMVLRSDMLGDHKLC